MPAGQRWHGTREPEHQGRQVRPLPANTLQPWPAARLLQATLALVHAGLDAPKKLRHAVRRRPEIAAEAGKPPEAGQVPPTRPPAAEAEVDVHDSWVILPAGSYRLARVRRARAGAG